MTRQLKADLMLLIITVFWGASYMLTKIGLETLQPFNLTALRFVIAFAITGPMFYKNILGADKKVLKYSFILAIILFTGFIAVTFGMKVTSASNAGFLLSLSVVFIPILSYMFFKQNIEKKVIAGVCLAVTGIALMTLNSELRISSGDLLCILGALLFAAHVVAISIYTRDVDSITLGVLQLGFVGIFSIIFSMLTEAVKLPDTPAAWVAVLLMSILCTAVGYIVQTAAQQYTSAAHTGLILALEPVFSAVFAFFVLGEILSMRGYIGAAILLLSVLVAELDFKKMTETEQASIAKPDSSCSEDA